MDRDTALILALVILIMKDTGDSALMLALLYILS